MVHAGHRVTDAHECSQLNELKMDMTGLNMLAGWTVNGDTIMVEQMPIFGGYCGGLEETAICDVATTLASFALFNGNFDLLLANQYYPMAGPCTEMCLIETACQAINDTGSGKELLSGSAAAKGVVQDKTTGMEARAMGEAALTAAGMKVSDLNEIIEKLVSGYEQHYNDAPAGLRFQECYDVKTVKPTAEYLQVYDNAMQQLRDAGLPIKH